ncbi:MAG: sigma-54 dependent transcriptional regulator, partial [Muribaculaceae bacterium]|nr:sigma-54 dependent transcriptional regulator [Muribaculaceae bacterium]
DDDNSVRVSLKLLLKRNGYEVATAATPAEAIAFVRGSRPDLVIMDMNYTRTTTGEEGLILLKQIKVFHPDVPVILITAWGNIPLAVEGIRAGAFDFITKPWDNYTLLGRITTALTLAAKDIPEPTSSFDRSAIIGRDPKLLSVLDTIERVAATNAPVLILGENGTGKELIAEAIHKNSNRRAGPMVKVNLGGLSQSLFESEMFGYRKGAFTGAVADREGRFAAAEKGTIFLDEIGDLDINSQVKLLRVLQEHTYEPLGDTRTRRADVRVVCATNADLNEMLKDGTFREDLFYRINLITVTLPPLRERRDDIPLLVEHLLRKVSENAGRETPKVTEEALELLKNQPWPGNIRQLANIVERTLLVTPGDTLDARDFQAQGLSSVKVDVESPGRLKSREKTEIENALTESAGNLTRAAALLGITRQTLYRRLAKYNIKYQ